MKFLGNVPFKKLPHVVSTWCVDRTYFPSGSPTTPTRNQSPQIHKCHCIQTKSDPTYSLTYITLLDLQECNLLTFV